MQKGFKRQIFLFILRFSVGKKNFSKYDWHFLLNDLKSFPFADFLSVFLLTTAHPLLLAHGLSGSFDSFKSQFAKLICFDEGFGDSRSKFKKKIWLVTRLPTRLFSFFFLFCFFLSATFFFYLFFVRLVFVKF